MGALRIGKGPYRINPQSRCHPLKHEFVALAQSATTLRFVPYVDLALLDPAVSAFVTRNHVLMVFDTLFGVDEAGTAQPQMLAGYTTEPDGLTWTLTLRDGLRFHDGSPVLARDAVASIRRWWVSDAFGQALAAATDDLSAPDDRTIASACAAASTYCPMPWRILPIPCAPSCRSAWPPPRPAAG